MIPRFTLCGTTGKFYVAIDGLPLKSVRAKPFSQQRYSLALPNKRAAARALEALSEAWNAERDVPPIDGVWRGRAAVSDAVLRNRFR